MIKLIHGRVWKYGDHVNTDVIFPGKYTYAPMMPAEMAQHALEDLDPRFAQAVRPGDILLAGVNWGCGSSREQAVLALVGAGVGAIIAASFARIYYRNAINNGLPAILSSQAWEHIEDGEEVTIDLQQGFIRYAKGKIEFPPFSGPVGDLLRCGGLIPALRSKLGE